MRALVWIAILTLGAGCGGSSSDVAGVVKDPASPEYGQSLAEKLKQDLAADPATAKATSTAAKPRSR